MRKTSRNRLRLPFIHAHLRTYVQNAAKNARSSFYHPSGDDTTIHLICNNEFGTFLNGLFSLCKHAIEDRRGDEKHQLWRRDVRFSQSARFSFPSAQKTGRKPSHS